MYLQPPVFVELCLAWTIFQIDPPRGISLGYCKFLDIRPTKLPFFKCGRELKGKLDS